MHHGVPYYYPVPVPYYAYYQSPPVGAIVVVVVGTAYLMSKDGSYSKKTTSSDGKEVYQAVPAPQGATIKTLPAERVLVTVSGTTYYVNANAFYRRVMNGTQETFVVVTPPAGVVFVQRYRPTSRWCSSTPCTSPRRGSTTCRISRPTGKNCT